VRLLLHRELRGWLQGFMQSWLPSQESPLEKTENKL
jgi:hypothetical protein